MSTATTLAPSAMNRSATLLPIPEPVPVTSATLPCNLPDMTMLPCARVCKTIPRYSPFLGLQLIINPTERSRGPRADERQHVTYSRDFLSRFAHRCTTTLLLGVYAPPIGIAQNLRITASQGRVQSRRALSLARIQVCKVGQQALYLCRGIGQNCSD